MTLDSSERVSNLGRLEGVVSMLDVVNKPLLWHYTDFTGMHGIVSEKQMWATNIAFLNDAREFKHTLDLLVSVVQEAFGEFPESEGNIADYIRRIMTQKSSPYVTSFSERADDLSQWRGYAHSTPSFSLGFARDALESVGGSILNCEYNPLLQTSEIAEIARASLNSSIAKYKASKSRAASSYFFWDTMIRERILFQLGDIAERNKSPKFADEKEVRLVFRDPPKTSIRYRKARSMIAPYFAWHTHAKGKLSPLRCVVVGPSPHQHDILLAAHSMLRQYGHEASIALSDVPYRY